MIWDILRLQIQVLNHEFNYTENPIELLNAKFFIQHI